MLVRTRKRVCNSVRLTISCDAKLDDDETSKHNVDDGDHAESHVGQ